MKIERRYVHVENMETRDDDGRMIISGYGSVYDMRSENLGGFVEVIRPGAFDRVLRKNPDVKCLLNHDPNIMLGRTKNGTMKLESTPIGLRYETELPDTTHGRDVYRLIQRGDIDQCSFAFAIGKNGDKWSEEDGVYLREIVEVSGLFDVSPVVYPAYPDTSVDTRSAKDIFDSFLASVKTNDEPDLTAVLENKRRRIELLK